MNILQILAMAKSDNSSIYPVFEAEGDKKIEIDVTQEDTDNTDYTEDADDTSDENEESTDYTEDVEQNEDTEEDTNEDPEPEDEESTDYTEDVTTDNVSEDDPPAEEEESEEDNETPENIEDVERQSALLDDFIKLYDIIVNNIDRLNSLTEVDININKVVIQVKKNLGILQDALFTLIIRTYSLNTYAKNLYLYNYFTQSLAINIEMLKKISVFIPNTQNKYIKNN